MDKAIAFPISRRRDFAHFFWTLAAAGLVLFAIVTIPPGARRSLALRRDLDRANSLHAGLVYKAGALEQWERALKTDPFFNEAVLRAKMKYRKPGEMEVSGAQSQKPFIPIETLRVPDFVPSRPPGTTLRAVMINWALLVASALCLGAAFLFFDGTAGHRERLTSPDS